LGYWLVNTIEQYEENKSIFNNTRVPTGLADAVHGMRVLEAVFQSSEQQRWIACKP